MAKINPYVIPLLLLKECDHCGGIEERLFTDSWTGKELCPMCLHKIMDRITMSPASEGDNLAELLNEEVDR